MPKHKATISLQIGNLFRTVAMNANAPAIPLKVFEK
jgi:hypothetical protein